MEIVRSRDICVLCREILRLINRKIMDHSSRVGYILYCMLRCEEKYEDYELAEFALPLGGNYHLRFILDELSLQ